WRFLWLSVALLSSTPRRRLLSSRKEKGDVSIDDSARGRMTAIWMESLSQWLSSSIRRCLKRWVSSTKESNDLTIGGSQRLGTWMDQDARSRFKTKINGVCCSGSRDGWMKTHDP
ncbi:hypothetical protein HID58_085824, partial [Brassica napus]